MREITAELGINFRNGPPTAEQSEQLRKRMIEAGLPMPDLPATARPGEVVVTTRKVYKLVGIAPAQSLEELTIKAGITDGTATEVLEGLKEGDVVVTSVTVPNATSSSSRPAANPFGGGGRRF
jgi:HlyD family secretion protein